MANADLRGAAGAADGARIRELTAARGRLVDELLPAGPARLGASRPAPAALREEVSATLDAALADPEVAANLGTLARAAHWSGFGLDAFPGGSSAPAPAPVLAKKPRNQAPAEAETEREDRRREKIMEAERTLAQADQDVEAASAAERDLEEAVRHKEAELADARQRLAEARRQSYRATSRQQRAARQLASCGCKPSRSAPGVNHSRGLVPLLAVEAAGPGLHPAPPHALRPPQGVLAVAVEVFGVGFGEGVVSARGWSSV